MNRYLSDLSVSLVQATGRSFGISASEYWGNPKPLSKVLALVSGRFESPLVSVNRRSVSQAVLRYRDSRELTDYLDIKYVCIGASEEFSGWCLLEDAVLLDKLLKLAQAVPDRWRLKYFSCLLRSYWSFPRDDEETTPASKIGWAKLRGWLDGQRIYLSGSIQTKPLWFQTLNNHANLLADRPCKRYGQELLTGVSASLNEALEHLGVPSDSWLRNEAIEAQMQAGIDLKDVGFQSCLSRLVDVATGKTEFRLSKSIATRCLARLVSRYAACSGRPEHMALRDAAIALIGNPWLHRTAWDSYVLDQNGEPDDDAREMVNGWLKVRLIKDFFDLLSEDRSADSRRLNYWLGFEPMIEDMWFALGADAMSDRRKDYAEFRQRANGRLLDLVGATPTINNAFLMHIGEYVVIEFGITGNACFAYRYNDLPARIKRRLNSGTTQALIDIAELKEAGYEVRLLHQGSWEPKFDAAICPLLGFMPSGGGDPRSSRGAVPAKNVQDVRTSAPVYPWRTSFSRLDFERFISRFGLAVDDRLHKGGCLWVRTDAANAQVCESLKNWGFSYRDGKGWWRE